jgi:hypothetical protein
MLANIFYRREFSRLDAAEVSVGDYDYMCDFRASILSDDSVLGQAFREFNAVDGTETCCRLRIRSMSVGDVVRTADGVFLCASTGWTELTGDVALFFGLRAKNPDFAEATSGCSSLKIPKMGG